MSAFGIACALLAPAFAAAEAPDPKKWDSTPEGAPEPGTREVPWVSFVALHTGETLPVFGEAPSKASFDFLLRCRATGQVAPIADPLPKLLLRAAKTLHAPVIEIIAGYRSDKFNEQLRKKGRQVADESFHRAGKAIDWRLRGVPLDRLYRFLKRVAPGGLGLYRGSNFVHTDLGPKREWRGR